MILFTIYVNVQVDFRDDPKEGEVQAPFEYNLTFKIINMLMLFTVQMYFLIMEIQQFIKDPGEYFTSFWNVGDVIALLLCMSVMV